MILVGTTAPAHTRAIDTGDDRGFLFARSFKYNIINSGNTKIRNTKEVGGFHSDKGFNY